MTVTVVPETFSYVAFSGARISRITDELAAAIGLDGRSITIEVDESTPLARTSVLVDEQGAIHIRADSGAFEDTRHPQQQSDEATATAVGRMLLRSDDRISGRFADAPPDADLSLAHTAAWETYSVGRLARLGVTINRQRWLYNFRNRHGFTDAGDAAFEHLWQGDQLTWAQMRDVSDRAAAATAV